MIDTIYKWTRSFYDVHDNKYLSERKSKMIHFCSPAWMESKTSDTEIAFFEGLGAEVDVYESDGDIFFNNTSPDSDQRTEEVFEPIDITPLVESANKAQRKALIAAAEERNFNYEMTDAGIVIVFADDAHANIDTMCWVD